MGERMRLRNKKTGEIMEFDAILPVKDVSGDSVAHLEYDSLAELNEEWEDAPEELKEYWYINDCGSVYRFADYYVGTDVEKANREIGNLFDTREEAELVVRKLRAWKRLKDKGFRFDRWDYDGSNYQEGLSTGRIFFRVKDYGRLEENDTDLDLLFPQEDKE